MSDANEIGRQIPARSSDPATSHIALPFAANQRTRMLHAFALLKDATDEEAMRIALGVSSASEYSKRCSELRDGGYIEVTGDVRRGASGNLRIVSRITDKGIDALRSGGVRSTRDREPVRADLKTRKLAGIQKVLNQAQTVESPMDRDLLIRTIQRILNVEE